jgi:pimeloyl-ACP methyl ester carboxylesterase
MAALQDYFLYFPDRLRPDRYAAEAEAAELAPWPSRQDFRALLREPRNPPRATAIVFHGNAGHAIHRAWYATVLTDLGLRVILAEYPGYGHRTGDHGEESFAADGAALLALAQSQFPGAIFVIGESLGAGVAAAVVARQPADALLLITPWKDLASVAGHHYPWLPTRWLLRDRYDTAANLATFRGPIVVVIAENDQVIPPSFGRALFAALPADRKRLFAIPAAGHNDWSRGIDEAGWRNLIEFLSGLN